MRYFKTHKAVAISAAAVLLILGAGLYYFRATEVFYIGKVSDNADLAPWSPSIGYEKSDYVVIGTLESTGQSFAKRGGGYPQTPAHITVDRVLKGSPMEEVSFIFAGGIVPKQEYMDSLEGELGDRFRSWEQSDWKFRRAKNIGFIGYGTLMIREGEKAIFFLEDQEDPYTGEEDIHFTHSITLTDDRTVYRWDKETYQPLEELIAEMSK